MNEELRKLIDQINSKSPTFAGSIRAVEMTDAQRDAGDEQSFELSFSSEDPYERWFGVEILGHKKSEVRMDWLKSGNAPLLLQHNHDQLIGIIESAKLEGGRGTAVVRFGKGVLAQEIKQDVEDGIRRNVSVGYRVHEMTLVKAGDETPSEYRVTDWEPFEVSSVSVPADRTVGTNRADSDTVVPASDPITKKEKEIDMTPEALKKEALRLGLSPDASLESVLKAQAKASRAEAVAENDAELVRQNSISQLASVHRDRISDVDTRATAAITGKVSVDAFRREILDLYTDGTAVVRTAAPAGSGRSAQERSDLGKFSIVKACRELCDGGGVSGLTGVEREMHQEGLKEAKESGIGIKGFAVPTMVLQRDLTVTTEGTDVVQTSISGFIELLRSKMVMTDLGATFLSGLVGNIQIPKLTGGATSAWEGENDAGSESTPTIGNLSLSPKRLGTFIEVSNQFLMQSSVDAERMLQNDLAACIASAIETAAIHGTGANDQPTGIVATSGIGSVAGGTNGLAPTEAHIIALETAVATDNADVGALSYLTNSKVRGKLKGTAIESGQTEKVWGKGEQPLNGYGAAVTNLVSSTLTKGDSDVCSAIIFGNFKDLIIAGWGGFEIRPNPYIKDTENLTRLTVNTYADVGVRHAESFAAMLDALTA